MRRRDSPRAALPLAALLAALLVALLFSGPASAQETGGSFGGGSFESGSSGSGPSSGGSSRPSSGGSASDSGGDDDGAGVAAMLVVAVTLVVRKPLMGVPLMLVSLLIVILFFVAKPKEKLSISLLALVWGALLLLAVRFEIFGWLLSGATTLALAFGSRKIAQDWLEDRRERTEREKLRRLTVIHVAMDARARPYVEERLRKLEEAEISPTGMARPTATSLHAVKIAWLASAAETQKVTAELARERYAELEREHTELASVEGSGQPGVAVLRVTLLTEVEFMEVGWRDGATQMLANLDSWSVANRMERILLSWSPATGGMTKEEMARVFPELADKLYTGQSFVLCKGCGAPRYPHTTAPCASCKAR